MHRTPIAVKNYSNKIQLDDQQSLALEEIFKEDSVVLLTGAAGSGKTATAIHAMFKLWKDKKIDRVIISRPNIDNGKSFGFLPGELEEKFIVYLDPIIDFINKFGNSGPATFQDMISSKQIEMKPLNFMQGSNYDSRTLVILDEAQNATEDQIRMLISRMGYGGRLILTGDTDQTNLRGEPSGIVKLKRVSESCDWIKCFEFLNNHRHPRITEFLKYWNE